MSNQNSSELQCLMTLLLIAPKLQARDCFFLVESKLIVFRHKTTRSRIGICQQNLVAASLADLSWAAAPVVKGKRSLLTSLFCGFRKRQLWISSKAKQSKPSKAPSLERTYKGGCPGPMTVPHLFLALPPRLPATFYCTQQRERVPEQDSNSGEGCCYSRALCPLLSAKDEKPLLNPNPPAAFHTERERERERGISLVPGSRTKEDARHAVASGPTNVPLLECK